MEDELDLSAMRRSYGLASLDEAGLAETWWAQFLGWFDAAAADPAVTEPNAVSLATVDAEGRPGLRTVLAKAVTARGLVFYTHYDSAKGRALAVHPYASALFAWLPQQRQVRLSGPVRMVSREETEHYFASRPRGSRIGAWASPQSEVVAGREVLDAAVEATELRFAGESAVPVPPRWGGYLLEPEQVEFWQGRENRMHDRIRFRRPDESDPWITERLAP